MTHRFAIVDMGSNTLKFSVTERGADGESRVLAARTATVRLAAGIAGTGLIDPSRMLLALRAMHEFKEEAAEHDANVYLCVATAALRMASNGKVLIDQIEAGTPWKVRIVSGDDEARLAFAGVAANLPTTGTTLVLDIGGGSTEAIRAQGRVLQIAESHVLGSGTLADRWFNEDPPGAGAVTRAWETASAVLSASPAVTAGPVHTVVLTGGNGMFLQAFANLREVDLPFTVAEFPALVGGLAKTKAIEVASAIGIVEERARMLPAGAAIAQAALDLTSPAHLLAMESGIRGGLIAEWVTASSKTGSSAG